MTFCRHHSTYRGTKWIHSLPDISSADSFRRFIIRTLTDNIPPDGDEKEIARFILRHPAFNGGWLLFLAAEIRRKIRTHNSITVTVSVDNYLMDGYCRIRSPGITGYALL